MRGSFQTPIQITVFFSVIVASETSVSFPHSIINILKRKVYKIACNKTKDPYMLFVLSVHSLHILSIV